MNRNVLICGVGSEGLNEKKIKLLYQKLRIDNLYGVYVIPDYKFECNYRLVINFWDIIEGHYEKYYNDYLAPIDDTILQELAPYEMEIMYQILRCGERWRDYDLRKNLYYRHVKYWSDFLRRYEITDVIFSGVPHEVYDYIVYILAKKRGIEVVVSDEIYFGYKNCDNRIIMSDFFYQDQLFERAYKQLLDGIQEIKNEQEIVLPEIMEQIYNDNKKIAKNLPNSGNTSYTSSSRKVENERYYGKVNFQLKRLLKKPILESLELIRTYHSVNKNYKKTSELVKYYDSLSVKPDYNKKYIYVPLHYTPECTSSPEGGIYADQILFIDILACAVPDDVYLYVKEHPTQIAFGRKIEFYERLKKLRNVILINQNADTYQLIANCIAVSTLTGTTGYECQYFGKPFIMFGYYIYKYMPGTLCVRTFQECKDAIDLILKGKIKWDNIDIKKFLKFVDTISVDISDENADEYVEQVVKLLEKQRA